METLSLLIPIAVALGVFASWRVYSTLQHRRLRSAVHQVAQVPEKDPYDAIESLSDFDWASTSPLQVWPFKPKYHLTMALENMPLSDLVAMDKTYLDRMRLRRSLLDLHPAETKQCNSVAEKAVLELYDWIVTTYLPKRFPTIYKVTMTPSGLQLLNMVSNSHLPIRPVSPMAALDTLGEHVDTDFLILLPSSIASDGSPIYHLEAFVTCFPSGFSTKEKCGNPLATIHAPVPGYASKLERSMDRFFAKLEPGRVVKRSNWSITTNDLLYTEGGNHMYGDEKQDKPVSNAKTMDPEAAHVDESIEQQKRDVVIDNCRLRCERQTLHRLPKTKALVFAFKTYQYKLEEVKAAGASRDLVDAIDGLAQGSVPAMAFYKRGVVWGEKVKEYLLS